MYSYRKLKHVAIDAILMLFYIKKRDCKHFEVALKTEENKWVIQQSNKMLKNNIADFYSGSDLLEFRENAKYPDRVSFCGVSQYIQANSGIVLKFTMPVFFHILPDSLFVSSSIIRRCTFWDIDSAPLNKLSH
jgi:hypothetical protein